MKCINKKAKTGFYTQNESEKATMFFNEEHRCANCIRFFGIFWEETIGFLQFFAFQSPLAVVILIGKPAKGRKSRPCPAR